MPAYSAGIAGPFVLPPGNLFLKPEGIILALAFYR
jgi:hypothetical protein